MVSDIEIAVLKWYQENYNARPLFSRTQPELSYKTSLNTGPYPWARETGDEIMQDYFQRFDVDNRGFDFLTYWPYEKGLIPNFLRPKSQRISDQAPKPLTLQMLIESAKAGRWLYDLKEA
ncbi:MAG: DUF1493 family protein [Pantoea sp. Morm]|uniref:DUF1493 family protein n=1 Tax=Pantoea sp. Morm TaxID=2601250 RepID=UPI001DE12F9A|nr:DUF1493 family protein [uncultured Pantoea sp.]MBK4769860.1 DUF1493 family protein [Pantoea sp. Morm]